jgi:hypothetical protein
MAVDGSCFGFFWRGIRVGDANRNVQRLDRLVHCRWSLFTAFLQVLRYAYRQVFSP